MWNVQEERKKVLGESRWKEQELDVNEICEPKGLFFSQTAMISRILERKRMGAVDWNLDIFDEKTINVCGEMKVEYIN